MASIISLSAGSTIARASSGSRSSISSIEPLMSANSAVTVLRSPSFEDDRLESLSHSACSTDTAISGVLENDTGDGAVVLLATSVVPQSPQKRLPGGFSAPHFGQR